MNRRTFVGLIAVTSIIACIVVCSGVARAADHQAFQTPPIQLGTSGGNAKDITSMYCCSGTLGALVTDGSAQYILSNNHVLALSNEGSPEDPITQPGLIDTRCGRDDYNVVANLTAWMPISFDGSTNYVDAAIAQVLPGMVSEDGSILGIGTISSETRAPRARLRVKKSGRTTGVTSGRIQGIGVTVTVWYSDECGGPSNMSAVFDNQMIIGGGGFSAGGDSGSVVVENVNDSPRAVGLLFAGSASYTLANPIDAVLSDLGGLSMVGGGVEPPPPPPGTGTITGTVLDSQTRDPISAARVKTDSGQSTKTDESGVYTLTDVPAGECTVTASAKGYQTFSQTASVPDEGTVDVSFELAPKTTGKPSSKSQAHVTGIDRAIEVKKRNDEMLLGHSSVVGTGVGIANNGRIAIQVYLNQEEPGTRGRLPKVIDNIPVQVIVTGPFVAY
ncbi:MAG: carboxypeptidase-like regulatory domain-containing protein [Phycisphaerales bacterium]|nr:MAG: carboxypeptidase-like regulatory domain-containing protein [Phycisphaerales bacterium]UCF14248.1 MAG: carboxypeptidase-like regulatory domain-containing protein [Phycisphaerales bacterium]